ncbi:DNA mismatch repair protein MutS [Nanoarchaeota archaeon]
MKLTPGMQQYMDEKMKYPDCILLFRMGDFYETFYEDAKLISRELEITLTARGKDKVPLAGVPYHALEPYLTKLVKKGYKVAICEQLENPKLAKGVVKRGVIRVITPGTLMDTSMLEENSNNYIMSIINEKDKFGIAISELSTGEFLITEANNKTKLINEITRINPSEIIVPETYKEELQTLLKENNLTLTINGNEDRFYYNKIALKNLLDHFNINNLSGFGIDKNNISIPAAGALINYLKETQMTSLDHINKIKKYQQSDYMILDSSSIRNLELIRNIYSGKTEHSLLWVLDKTVTSMGSRLIRNIILKPLIEINKINARLSAVEELYADSLLREESNDLLKNIADIERLISKVAYGNVNGRDLIALKNSLYLIPELKKILTKSTSALLLKLAEMNDQDEAVNLIEKSIKDDCNLLPRDGNVIKDNYNKELDELRQIKSKGKEFIKTLQENEVKTTGIKSLKVKFNRVFGYFIEVTKPNLHLVPENYIRKQTQVNSERFITPELKEWEVKILGAEDKAKELEQKIFKEIVEKINVHTKDIQKAALNIAMLDVLISFAKVSALNDYVKPELTNNDIVEITDGRHPVLEQIEDEYIPNDCIFNQDERFKIITGPNMAGKSSFMRQIALIQLLAQTGCFIPASKAKLCIVDRIFTRVGAHDDLASGQSTFMVEMNETANILNNATDKSLIILDEIGRGTSTFDGVSIAWSVAEFIVNKINAKTLFATHYHILNKLENEIPKVKNYNIVVDEKDDKVIFLRKIVKGGTDKSYGIQVSKLAGLPENVIDRAKEIQFMLEEDDTMKEKIVVERELTDVKRFVDKWNKKEVEEQEFKYKKSKQTTLTDV